MVLKGKEINEFMEKNNIQIRNESSETQVKAGDVGGGDEDKGSAGVLVASSSST